MNGDMADRGRVRGSMTGDVSEGKSAAPNPFCPGGGTGLRGQRWTAGTRKEVGWAGREPEERAGCGVGWCEYGVNEERGPPSPSADGTTPVNDSKRVSNSRGGGPGGGGNHSILNTLTVSEQGSEPGTFRFQSGGPQPNQGSPQGGGEGVQGTNPRTQTFFGASHQKPRNTPSGRWGLQSHFPPSCPCPPVTGSNLKNTPWSGPSVVKEGGTT